MKVFLQTRLLLAFSLVSNLVVAQTNTFPPSGNVGIGTYTPQQKFVVSNNNAEGFEVFLQQPVGVVGVQSYNRTANQYSKMQLVASQFELAIGNVGVGTSTPNERLSVQGNIQLLGSTAYVQVGSRMTLQSPYVGQSDATRAIFSQNVRFNPSVNKWSIVDQLYNDFSMIRMESNGIISFYTKPAYSNVAPDMSGSDLEAYKALMINWDGHVGIGTNSPGSYKLAVEGTIGARKVKVTTLSWADYVFEPTYKLRPLQELDNFIKTHKHLPEVPSATEIEKEGLDVGESQATLLKKIEELTLYIIEQDKRQLQQDKLLQEQAQKLEGLQKELQALKFQSNH